MFCRKLDPQNTFFAYFLITLNIAGLFLVPKCEHNFISSFKYCLIKYCLLAPFLYDFFRCSDSDGDVSGGGGGERITRPQAELRVG